MDHTKILTFDLPVASIKMPQKWADSPLRKRIAHALDATDGACSAIVLESPYTSASRPSSIHFLCSKEDGPVLAQPIDMDEDSLQVLSSAALLLENDQAAKLLFKNMDVLVSRLRAGKKFRQIAITRSGVIGWHRSNLASLEDGDQSIYSQARVILGAFSDTSFPGSAHWALAAQAEIGEVASLLYSLETGHAPAGKLEKSRPKAHFQVKPISSAIW